MKDADFVRLNQIITQTVRDDLNVFIKQMVERSELDTMNVTTVKLRDVYECICDAYSNIVKDIRKELTP